MFIWGSGGDTIDLGEVETKYCGICEKERPFHIVLQYKYQHIWYLFGSVSEKKYLYLCDICHRGWELDKKKVEQELGMVPIPFMRRHGGKILAGIIVLIIILAISSS